MQYLSFQVETEKKEIEVKVEETREEWAVMEDTEKTVENFHRLVPDMAHKVRVQSHFEITEVIAPKDSLSKFLISCSFSFSNLF